MSPAHGQTLTLHHQGIGLLDAETATGDLAKGRDVAYRCACRGYLADTQQESPWDIVSASVTLQGAPSLWRPALTAKFRNESLLQYAGTG